MCKLNRFDGFMYVYFSKPFVQLVLGNIEHFPLFHVREFCTDLWQLAVQIVLQGFQIWLCTYSFRYVWVQTESIPGATPSAR